MVKKIAKRIYKSLFSPNVKKYMVQGDSILTESFSLEVRNPELNRKYLHIGNDCLIGGKFVFESREGLITIGNRVFIGNSQFISRSKIEIGSNIFIAWGACFLDHNSHSIDYKERQKDMERHLQDYRSGQKNLEVSKDWSIVKTKPIKICDNAWIGMNCIILKGVTIGYGSIVSAGSVVTQDVPDWTLVSGNPAQTVRQLEK